MGAAGGLGGRSLPSLAYPPTSGWAAPPCARCCPRGWTAARSTAAGSGSCPASWFGATGTCRWSATAAAVPSWWWSWTARCAPDGGVELSVRDNGQGVPAEHRERVFGVFERLEDPSTSGAAR